MDWMVSADEAQSVPPLRREIMAQLRRHASRESDFASAELVIAELLSNAVAHGPDRARVTLRWDGEHPVLSVAGVGRGRRADRLPEPAVPADLPADPLADGGRGLYIAERLSRGLDVQARPHGSVVSATLNLRRRADRQQAAPASPAAPGPAARDGLAAREGLAPGGPAAAAAAG